MWGSIHYNLLQSISLGRVQHALQISLEYDWDRLTQQYSRNTIRRAVYFPRETRVAMRAPGSIQVTNERVTPTSEYLGPILRLIYNMIPYNQYYFH
jgi:hypothetical protein